jgi:SAM-dependent methyltransferase
VTSATEPRESPPPHREIRSYVLRQGRMSPAQRDALVTLLPRYGLAFAAAPLDFEGVFARRAPRVLEIGCGMGETTAAIAQARPEQDYVAIDVHTPGIASLLRRIDAQACERAGDRARCGRGGRGDDSAGFALRASTCSSRTRGRRSAITSAGC